MFLRADLAFSIGADRAWRDIFGQNISRNLIYGRLDGTEENEFLCRGMFCEIIENLLGQVGVYFEIDVSRRLVFRIVSFPGKMDNSIDIRNRTVFKIPPRKCFLDAVFLRRDNVEPVYGIIGF